jgi:hypothetical protein
MSKVNGQVEKQLNIFFWASNPTFLGQLMRKSLEYLKGYHFMYFFMPNTSHPYFFMSQATVKLDYNLR